MERKAANRHVFLRMVREVEMSRDWFRSVFIVNLDISEMFASAVISLRPVSPMYIFLHEVQVM